MEFNIQKSGLRAFFREDGFYEIIINPEELPFEHGIGIYEITCDFNLCNIPIQSGNKGNCFCIVFIESVGPFNTSIGIVNAGDTPIQLDHTESYDFDIENRRFLVHLLRNVHGRLGTLKIELKENIPTFEQSKEIMFSALNHFVNLIAVTYGVPIRPSSFVINYDILNVFSVVEAKPKIKKGNDLLANSLGKSDKWIIAINHYRRALLCQDPQSKFMGLFVVNEMLRSLIKDELGMGENESYIEGKGYKEPRINGIYEIDNGVEIFNIKGKTYSSVLTGTFKKLRNAAADHKLEDCSFKNISNLRDYIEYYSAIPYLIEIFEGYFNELDKLVGKRL